MSMLQRWQSIKLKQEGKELTGKQVPTKKLLLELLRKNRVNEFNEVRFKDPLSSGDLSYAYLSSADLPNANLSYAKLSGISKAYLSGADLSGADLSYTDLSYTDLLYANLSKANLDSSIIIGVTVYENNLKCTGAFFNDAIIDDERLLDQLRVSGGESMPSAAGDKKELREKLEKREVDSPTIERLLSLSHLAA